MIRRRLKLYTYHSFLVIPFVVLFLYVHNLSVTRFEMIYRTLLIGTLLSLILYTLVQLVFKNRLKTGVFVSFLLFFLFQYGVIYEALESLYYKGIWPFSNIHRYLLILYLITGSSLFWFMKKSRHDFIRINYFLNALIIVLLLFNLFKIAFSSYSVQSTPKLIFNSKEPDLQFAKSCPRPDIYYIVLDGYASNSVLKKYYSFQNFGFTSELKGLGFRFCDSAFANYYYTSGSLAATLNYSYLNDSLNKNSLIRNNRLFSTLSRNGYSIYSVNSGYAVTSNFELAKDIVFIGGPNEFEKSILKFTILRLDDLFGFFAHQRLESQFENMGKLPEIETQPKFSFLHIVAPHPPYVFDRNGKLRTKHKFAENSWEPKAFYIDQMVYLNRQIETFVRSILNRDPNAVIIIQSDHGPWIKGNREEVFEARSGILFAYYCKQKLNVPSNTSSVNTFRYFMNSLFGTGMPILSDQRAGEEELLRDPVFVKKVKKPFEKAN